MKIKHIISGALFFAFALFMTSCGSSATEADLKQAEESAKELENIDYENIEMPDAGSSEEETEEDFDADAMLD